jgi:TatD DNase family protein
MATDAHCHLSDLLKQVPQAEQERRRLGIACAASAWNIEDFICHEELARNARRDKAPRIFLCFALHPQLPAVVAAQNRLDMPRFSSLLDFMETLAREARIQGCNLARKIRIFCTESKNSPVRICTKNKNFIAKK